MPGMALRRNRDWKGSVRSHKGWLLLALKDGRGKWVERAAGLRDDSPENWKKARALLAEKRAAWSPAPPDPDPFRSVGRNSRNRSFKKRRGSACEVCGWTPRPPLRPSAVNAHHVRPRSEGGNHSDENRIVLCPNHHAVAHALHRESPSRDRDDLLARIRAWEDEAQQPAA
jgi:hypothetical protein